MLRAATFIACVVLVSTSLAAQEPAHEDHPKEPGPKPVLIQKHLTPVSGDKVKLREGFWTARLDVNKKVTLEAALKQCEDTGRIRNFAIAAGKEQGERKGLIFDDSDVYKVIEAMGSELALGKDAALEARADALIEKVAAAQRDDGYLNTYYQLVEPQKRWTNMKDGHELFCAGHLIEAAVAYSQATGKTKLLDVAKKLADHIDRTFGPKKKLDPCGHPEIELALVKLGKATGEKRYLDLAKFFIDQRGNLAGRTSFGEYAQDQKPLREQTEIVGHAVRAMYLYSGAADVAAATGDETLIPPLEKIWKDVVERKMYVTGGIGNSAANEGFTKAFDLPNDSAYCETCASIGMAMWSQRMLLATGEAKYADIVEKELYNAILSGVSISGDKFFYQNPLSSRGDKQRAPWFECACCPSNLVRFLPTVSSLVFATSGNTIYVCQYIPCEADLEVAGQKVHIKMQTDWPNNGQVSFAINPEKPATFALRLRRPGWCKTVYYQHDLKEQEHKNDFPGTEAGWELYERPYAPNDGCGAHFFSPVRREHAAPEVTADAGRVAICRGAMVYAIEGIDNQGRARSIAFPPDASTSVFPKPDAVIGTQRAIKAKVLSVDRAIDGSRTVKPFDVTLIPYWLWANRGPSEMTVWIPETADLAEIPGEGPTLDQNGARLSASHCWRGDTLAALNDGRVPKSSSDDSIPRLSFWDHRGTTEWVQYEYPADKKLSSTRVYWYDDGDKGTCRVPFDWVLKYRDLNDWVPVVLKGDSKYSASADGWNSIQFEPINTQALRLELHLKKDVSGGVLEWEAK